MRPGNSAANDDWTSPDPWIHEQQGTIVTHGPGPGGRER